jgi:hypothetical protein
MQHRSSCLVCMYCDIMPEHQNSATRRDGHCLATDMCAQQRTAGSVIFLCGPCQGYATRPNRRDSLKTCPSYGKIKNMVLGLETKIYCADDGQQQFNRLTDWTI